MLTRQIGIIRETAAEDEKDESEPEYILPDSITLISSTSTAPTTSTYTASVSSSTNNSSSSSSISSFSNSTITTSTITTSSSCTAPIVSSSTSSNSTITTISSPVTLLQVPGVVMASRENLSSLSSSSSSPSILHKQSSHPTPLLVPSSSSSGGPTIITKQISHPECSIPRLSSGSSFSSSSSPASPSTSQGPPPMSKQRSHPGVLTHTTTVPQTERSNMLSTCPTSSSATTSDPQQQQFQLVQVYLPSKQKSTGHAAPTQQPRPIQPKIPGNSSEAIKKEVVPLIRLTPSEEPPTSFHLSSPHRPLRAASEEPRHLPGDSQTDLLSPSGPSPLLQSVSQDSALDSSGAGLGRLLGQPAIATSLVSHGLTQSTPGHCPVLREGPALGCNYCWNSSDSHGRVLRRKTKYHCPECRTNLCIVPCFHEYHRQIERQMDTQKQINKILTKPSSM